MRWDYMTTYTKVHFTPLDPKTEDIRITDIAHALSLMTRANGHFKHFYSVAQHSINCAYEARAMICNKAVQLACLLHDASEAYIADLIRPIKQCIPAYLKIENTLQNAIFRAYELKLTIEEQAKVNEIDDAILWHEFFELSEPINAPKPILHSSPDFSERRFSDVKQEFLRLFDSLTGVTVKHKCIGVDGTKGGWIASFYDGQNIQIKLFKSIQDLCAEYNDADFILIDIPVGLPERKSDMRPDAELRKRLSGKSSSVFNTPCRQALNAADYAGANAINMEIMGKGLSKQSYAICDKIKEVDDFLQDNPIWKNKLLESHPEYGFMVLNYGKPIIKNKKTQEGMNARISTIRSYAVNSGQLIKDSSSDSTIKNRIDDILDAVCLSIIGFLGATNGFLSIPDVPLIDSKGLKMQIIFAEG